jgi:hypothetical protein
MSRTAARHQHHAPATAHGRARAAPPPRRVSGPAVRGGAVALPTPARRSGATGTFERVLRLPDHRMVDRLLRGRAWIWLVGILLGGIVAMQVSLLKLNTGISRAVEASATLERQNSDLEASIARLSSSERTRTEAERQGMIMPPAGEVAYLTVRPNSDPARALAHMRPPSDAARELMANNGILPGSLPAATGTSATGAGASATAAAGAGTTPPAGTGTGTAATGTAATGAAATGAAATGAAATGTAATGTAATGTAPTGTSAGGATPTGATGTQAGGATATGATGTPAGGATATGAAAAGGTAPTAGQG